jgi:DNA-binding response OmpR family regulator
MGETVLQILLVEDDAEFAQLLADWLRAELRGAAALYTRRSLRDAMEHLRTHTVDVLLLDLNLPDSRELDTLQAILARFPATPTVIVTGLPEEDLALAAIRAGAQDYLPKIGLTGARLATAIRYAMLRHQRLSVLFGRLEAVTHRLARPEEDHVGGL